MSNNKGEEEEIRKENREGFSIREKRVVKRVAVTHEVFTAWKLEYIKLC